jgi:restriction system protein
MQGLTKLAILIVVVTNLAGLRTVTGSTAALAGLGLVVLAALNRLGLTPAIDRHQRWLGLMLRHRDALTKRFRQLVRPNAYGYEETDKWLDELDRFRLSVDLRVTREQQREFDQVATRIVRRWAGADEETAHAGGGEELTPQDYEHHCADLLRRSGWTAEVTGMSGDQGADVVAERDGVSIAIQCKLFSKPVGNKAVQEAHAAAGFVETGHAAVVTNAAYTRSAEALAHKLGVLLLHHSELPQLDRLIGLRQA